MPKVLVTGGAGYLGSILCEHLLDQGHSVVVLDNLLYGQHSVFHLCANPAFNFEYGDARDEATVARLVRQADGELAAVKFPREGAGILTSLVEADGLVELPEAMTKLEPGSMVDFLPFAGNGS